MINYQQLNLKKCFFFRLKLFTLKRRLRKLKFFVYFLRLFSHKTFHTPVFFLVAKNLIFEKCPNIGLDFEFRNSDIKNNWEKYEN